MPCVAAQAGMQGLGQDDSFLEWVMKAHNG